MSKKVRKLLLKRIETNEKLVANPHFDQGTTVHYHGKLEAYREMLKDVENMIAEKQAINRNNIGRGWPFTQDDR